MVTGIVPKWGDLTEEQKYARWSQHYEFITARGGTPIDYVLYCDIKDKLTGLLA